MAKQIGLFVGIESYQWTLQDFQNFINFCKTNAITQVFLKVYEITQGEWYTSIGGADAILALFRTNGIDVIPYGYFYGVDPASELIPVQHYLSTHGSFCMDMEGEFDAKAGTAQVYADALKDHVGTLYISTWANPVTHSWVNTIDALDPVTQYWMPQAYTDVLVKDMYAQFPKVMGKILPTFHIQNTPAMYAQNYDAFTLWEYQLATPQLLQQFQGTLSMTSYPTNPQGLVANFVPTSEFQPGHTEFACGAFAISLLLRSTNYNVANNDNEQNLINWAEAEYAKTAGDNGPSNTNGASIDDMHTYIFDTQSDASGGLHYWDTDIQQSTTQDHDIATIKAAIQHGYCVVATVSEASVYDLDLGRNPYWWGPSGNHILIYAGIASDGNLLCIDAANVMQGDGNLQTTKTVQPWPRRYDITKLDNQWATIIKTPWLSPIPSGDPLSWPPYVGTPTPPPVQPDASVSVVYDPNAKQLIFMNGVSALYRIQL